MNNLWMNYKRSRKNWLSILVSFFILPVLILVYLQFEEVNIIGKIAVKNIGENQIEYYKNNNIVFEVIEGSWDIMALIGNDYIGYINYDDDGGVIDTEIFIQSYEDIMHDITSGNSVKTLEKTNIFIKLYPSIVVILFIQATLNLKNYIDDRENGNIKRICMISNKFSYIFAMFCFNALCSLFAFGMALVLGKVVYQINYEFSFGYLFLVIVVTSIISNLMALALGSVVKNNASVIMVGNISAVLTSLLSGVFGSWKLIEPISKIMPQRILLQWVEAIYQNKRLLNSNTKPIGLLILLFLIIVIVGNKKN